MALKSTPSQISKNTNNNGVDRDSDSDNDIDNPNILKDESLVFTTKETCTGQKSWFYNRGSSAETDLASKMLSDLYDAQSCYLTPSGMAAISAALHGSIQAVQKRIKLVASNTKLEPQQGSTTITTPKINLNLIYGSQLFSKTPKLLRSLAQSYHCQLHQIDLIEFAGKITADFSDAKLVEKFSGQHNILFIESCSNPDGYMLSPDFIHSLRNCSSTCTIIVDNTWLSVSIFNPLKLPYNADVCVTSLTKYYTGGTAIGGAIIFPKKTEKDHKTKKEKDKNDNDEDNDDIDMFIEDHIYEWLNLNGNHVSPSIATIISKQLRSLEFRISKSSSHTREFLNLWKKFNANQVDETTPKISSNITSINRINQIDSTSEPLLDSKTNDQKQKKENRNNKTTQNQKQKPKQGQKQIQKIDKQNHKITIIHPYLEDHPSHQFASRYWYFSSLSQPPIQLNIPAVFTFNVPHPLKRVKKILEKRQDLFEYKTSFGGAKSRIDCFPTEHRDILDQKKFTRCRLSIGYDDSENGQNIFDKFIKLSNLLLSRHNNESEELKPTISGSVVSNKDKKNTQTPATREMAEMLMLPGDGIRAGNSDLENSPDSDPFINFKAERNRPTNIKKWIRPTFHHNNGSEELKPMSSGSVVSNKDKKNTQTPATREMAEMLMLPGDGIRPGMSYYLFRF